MGTKIVKLECTFVFDVEVPDDPDYDAEFDLVYNHCIGTGRPGQAFEALMKKHEEESTCWACALGAKVRIVG